MNHHAYVIEGEGEQGISTALAHIEKELGLKAEANPDVIVFRYGLLAVDDVRKIIAIAAQAPMRGEHKAMVIAASRMYHEAQNALLKLFEEPPKGTTLFLVIPELGQLLPTLRSRIQVLGSTTVSKAVSDSAVAFLKMSAEKRSAHIKKLTTATDEDARREARDEAVALVNSIEAAAYSEIKTNPSARALLADIAELRGFLHDRSAPVKMILEHLALTTSQGLPAGKAGLAR